MKKQAVWKGKVIAESDRTTMIENNHYFPPDSIHEAHFKPSDMHTTCPWKGEASYYHIEVDGERNDNSAWYYPKTKPAADVIEGYVAFWRGVEVRDAD